MDLFRSWKANPRTQDHTYGRKAQSVRSDSAEEFCHFGPLAVSTNMRRQTVMNVAPINPLRYSEKAKSSENFVLEIQGSSTYRTALQDFSRQLPNKPHRHFRVDTGPWSQIGAAHMNEAKMNGNRNAFRKAKHPLAEMESVDWLKKKTGDYNLNAVTGLQLEDDVWKSFVNRDTSMDELKKFNSSNIDVLEKKRKAHGMRHPSDFDYQIRCCVANPDSYSETWKILSRMLGNEILEEYVNRRKYSAHELDGVKLDEELANRLKLSKENIRVKKSQSQD
ncbi:hypothetical protein DdX_06344 [Ditylenchus destructor]|uniref:Uncharacterized protein n=1 Tax=Ditylenchus destructor TaxID=166010 RepID=A0AAD4R8T8_9BILA|nr:hypothetical protein DdX_06344 [Ditylenchus destructor]